MKIYLIPYFIVVSFLTVVLIEILYSGVNILEIFGVFLLGFGSFVWLQLIIFFTYFLLKGVIRSKLLAMVLIPVITIALNWILVQTGWIEEEASTVWSEILSVKPTLIFAVILLVIELVRLLLHRKGNYR